MISPLEFANNHRRALRWLAGFVVIYSLLGFFLVPWLVKSQLSSLLQDRLQLETEIESLSFNPYTFYTELNGMAIREADGSPLLTLESFSADLQFTRLLILQVRLAQVALSGMDLHLARNSETDNTLSSLAQRWQNSQPATATEAQTAEEPSSLFPLTVASVQLDNLRTHLTDEVPAGGFATQLSIDTASIDNLSTLIDSPGTHALSLSVDNEANLQTSGSFSINPLRFQGDLSLQQLALAPFSPYVSSTAPVTLESGQLGFAVNYDVDLAGDALQLELTEFELALESLALALQDSDSNFLQLASLSATQGQLRLPENSASLSELTVSELNLVTNRNADGIIDLQQLTENSGTDQAEPTAAPANESVAESWSVALDQLSLVNNQITFSDQALRTPYTRTATVNLQVSDINNAPGTQLPFELSLDLDSGGNGQLAGELTVLPEVSAEATLTLEAIALNAIDPFLSEVTTLNLQQGELNSNLSILSQVDEPLAVNGDLAISDVTLIDTVLEAPLLTLPSLEVDNLNYSVANNTAEVSELTVAGLGIRVIINEDGSTNLGRSVRPTNTESSESEEIAEDNAESTESSLPAITIGRISLQDVAADFTDRDLPFEFNANVQDLNANIDNISNTTSELTQASLEGRVGEFGLMQLDTELDPFNFVDAANIDLRFSNIDLPEATPYVIKFAGREVDAGTVDLRLNYTLENQSLNANNQMTLNSLELGEEIDYPDAMDLPLDLALALLKDSNGVIEFEVPVSGEINDPEFDLGPAIRRAITNILTNIVAAPFRLLGNLVGAGEDANIDQIRFLPGRSDIAAPEQQKLLQLAEALAQRPELQLEVPLLQGGESDRLALKTAAVTTRIETLLAENQETELSLVERQTVVLENLYSAGDMADTLETIRALHTTITTPEADTATAEPATQFDVIAYNNDLRDRLIQAEPITEADLNSLALQRLNSLREYLVANSSLAPERVLQDETVVVEEDEEGWLVLELGLGSS